MFVFLCCYVGRVVYLNNNTEKPQIEIYAQGDFVEYGNNFYLSNSEDLCGYSIKAVSAKLMTLEAYIKLKNLSYDEFKEKLQLNSVY